MWRLGVARRFDSGGGVACYWGMRVPPKKKASAAKLRSWRASILRSRAIPLGIVHAPDERAAEAAAVKQFGLDDEQRKRLVVWERD